MKKWLRIDEQRPEEQQPVWYWFGFFDKVYAGFFETTKEDGLPEMDCFFDPGRGGFLNDDVTWWMPRIEGEPEPEPPTMEQKKACRYHPLGDSEEEGFVSPSPSFHVFLREIANKMSQENYEFTVTVEDMDYDVYWFIHDDKIGQIAFAMIDGKAIIHYLRAGRHTKEEVTAAIAAGE